MAKNNNKKNELVRDSDSTSELQELTLQQVLAQRVDDHDIEVDDDTFEIERLPVIGAKPDVEVLRADLVLRSETVNRLQFDVERLRGKLKGLESEVRAREDLGRDLNREIDALKADAQSRQKLLAERDRTIKELKSEIRERASAAHKLQLEHDESIAERNALAAQLDDIRRDLERLSTADDEANATPARKSGSDASQRAHVAELAAKLGRNEAYADELRRQLSDASVAIDERSKSLRHTETELSESKALVEQLEDQLRSQGADNQALGEQIAVMQARHNEAMAGVQAGLGDAEQGALEARLYAEQLEADLTESRRYRDEFERMLTESSRQHEEHLDALERALETEHARNAELEHKLAEKTRALDSLLADIAEQPEADSPDDDAAAPDETGKQLDGRPRERVNRMLIGRIDNQELRFPLFKNRLTIGRTRQNDIQLNVPYISRRHAVILTEGDTTRVIDWGSRNGVFVNSRRVSEQFLESGDQIAIGNAEFRYEERPRREH